MAKLTLTDIAGGYGLITTYNNNNALIEAALENTLSRDGTSPNTMSANLDMNSNRIVNLAAPSGNQDAATKTYVDTAITALGVGEIDFSTGANYTITGAWTFSGNQNFSGNVVITDGATADHTIYESGGALYIENDTGGSQFLQFNDYGSMVLADGMSLRVNSTPNTASILLNHDGVSSFRITNFQGTEDFEFASSIPNVNVDCNLVVEDGHYFRVYDGSETLYGQILHDGSDVQITTGGSNAPININPGGTEPVKIETGNLMLAEAGGAATDLAGWGQFWVQSSTPNRPKFTDDGGNDYELSRMETGTFTGTLTGCTTSPNDVFSYIKEPIGSSGQYRITIYLPDSSLTATSNTTAMTITGLPAALTSTTYLTRINTYVQDNSNFVPGMITIVGGSSTMTFWIYDGATEYLTSGFTNTGSKGLPLGWSVTYIQDLDN